jgi:hypothetical protein
MLYQAYINLVKYPGKNVVLELTSNRSRCFFIAIFNLFGCSVLLGLALSDRYLTERLVHTHVKIISDLMTKIDVNFREKFNDFTKKDVTFLTVNTRYNSMKLTSENALNV